MSVQAITCALAIRGVSASEKLLLLALANYADEKMRCWPSQARLAADTSLTDRTVRGLLSALEERGLLSRAEQRRQDGSRTSDLITLHFHGEVTKQAEIISGGAAHISGGAEMVSGGVRKSLPGGGEMVSGLTTFEPSSTRQEEPLSHPARERVDVSRQQLADVREAAGDALASMATNPGIASLATLTALLREGRPCDWHLDVLPAVTSAAAWHRAQDGPGSMKSWKLASKMARENRDRRLNPPPVEPARVRPSAPSGPDPRTAARLERFEAYEDASRAALRQNTG